MILCQLFTTYYIYIFMYIFTYSTSMYTMIYVCISILYYIYIYVCISIDVVLQISLGDATKAADLQREGDALPSCHEASTSAGIL